MRLDNSTGWLNIDADQATCLILACPPSEETRWAEHLTQAMGYPERITGY